MAELDLPSFKKYSIFINFWELFIIYFNHIQYPFFSSNSSQIHPTSLPNFILSLSVSIPPSLPLFLFQTTHRVQFVLPIHSQMWESSMEHCWPKENWLSLAQKPSTVRSSPVRDGGSWTPSTCPRVFTGLILCRSYVGSQLLGVHKCSDVSCPEDTVFFWSYLDFCLSQSFDPYPIPLFWWSLSFWDVHDIDALLVAFAFLFFFLKQPN